MTGCVILILKLLFHNTRKAHGRMRDINIKMSERGYDYWVYWHFEFITSSQLEPLNVT